MARPRAENLPSRSARVHMAVVVNPTRLALALCLLALPALAAPDPAEQSYQAARKGYYALKKDPKRRKFRDSWLTVAHRFERVAKKYPTSPRAPDSLFTAAQLLSDLSRISLLAEDATASMDDYRTLLEGYPRSTLADDAALALARAYLDREQPDAARKVLQRAAQLPKGDQTARLRALAASLPPEAKEPARKAGKAESVARRETPSPEPRPAAPASNGRRDPRLETRSSKTTSKDLPAVVDRRATAPSRGDPRPGASARVPPETRSTTVVTVRQGPAVETPDWLKDVTASRTPSVERETRPSDEARTPDEDDERLRASRSAEPVAETPTPAARRRAGPEATRRRDRCCGCRAGPLLGARPTPGHSWRRAPPTQVRERLRAIGKRGPSEVTLAEQLGLKFRRVVIDPGHGGHDTGTIGEGGRRRRTSRSPSPGSSAASSPTRGSRSSSPARRDRFVRLEERARHRQRRPGRPLHLGALQLAAAATHPRDRDLHPEPRLGPLRHPPRRARERHLREGDVGPPVPPRRPRHPGQHRGVGPARHPGAVGPGLAASRARTRRSATWAPRRRSSTCSSGRRCRPSWWRPASSPTPRRRSAWPRPGYQDDVARAIASGVQDFLGNRDRLAKAN